MNQFNIIYDTINYLNFENFTISFWLVSMALATFTGKILCVIQKTRPKHMYVCTYDRVYINLDFVFIHFLIMSYL